MSPTIERLLMQYNYPSLPFLLSLSFSPFSPFPPLPFLEVPSLEVTCFVLGNFLELDGQVVGSLHKAREKERERGGRIERGWTKRERGGGGGVVGATRDVCEWIEWMRGLKWCIESALITQGELKDIISGLLGGEV